MPGVMETDRSPFYGKLLITGIVVLALLLAGFSWWFRFQATHRTAQFLGPDAARLIRDAPLVEAFRWNEPVAFADHSTATGKDVTHARGITHLRAALLEDRSYDWDSPHDQPRLYRFCLRFTDAQRGQELSLYFDDPCEWMDCSHGDALPKTTISCRPISDGLRTIFAELFPNDESAGETVQPAR